MADVSCESSRTLTSAISADALVEAAEGALVHILARLQSAWRRRKKRRRLAQPLHAAAARSLVLGESQRRRAAAHKAAGRVDAQVRAAVLLQQTLVHVDALSRARPRQKDVAFVTGARKTPYVQKIAYFCNVRKVM